MKKEILKKKGFTLMEILVVMAIAMVLSSLAVNGYLQYRKSALIALSADNIVSQISALRGETIHGISSGDVEGGRSCRGIYFEKTDDGFLAKSFSQSFVGKKVWGGESAGWIYQGCGDSLSADLEFRDFELDEQVHIKTIGDELGSGFEESVVLRFVPPKGDLEFRENFGSDFENDFSNGEGMRIKIQYGLSDDSDYQKDIFFDFFNLKAHVEEVV